jgi:hypothetical protein
VPGPEEDRREQLEREIVALLPSAPWVVQAGLLVEAAWH